MSELNDSRTSSVAAIPRSPTRSRAGWSAGRGRRRRGRSARGPRAGARRWRPLASARMQRPGPAVTAGIAGAGLAVGAIAWRALWQEPRSGRVRERELDLGERWPAALDGLRVALVSDLHAGAPHVGAERIARLVAAVNAQRPDLVLLLGDYIDPEVRFGSRVAPGTVAERLAGLRAPLGVVAVLGNHDWHNDGPGVRAALRAAGVPVLENEARRTGELWVAGVEDTRHKSPDVDRALHDVPDGAA